MEEVIRNIMAAVKYFKVLQGKQKTLLGSGKENSELTAFTFTCVHE